MLRGDPAALSVTEREPDAAPVTEGVNVRMNVHDALGASVNEVPVHVPVLVFVNAPVTVTVDTIRFALPMF